MNWLSTAFGSGAELDALQMSARGVAVFLLTLLMIRLAGRRSFGQRSSFDTCVMVLLGSVLSRAVVGASPFFPTIAAGVAMVLLHRATAMISLTSPVIDRMINGSPRVLFENGELCRSQLRKGEISILDIEAAVRKKCGDTNLSEVERIVLERNGELTVISHTAAPSVC
jgi:uncharacterized membrane protein YcaP (DUF421 family)